MALRDLILDAWTSIAYKTPLKDEIEARRSGYQAKSWLPDRDRRRLAAYLILAAYGSNVARSFISDGDDTLENREYGDAALIIDQVLAHLLGESQEIVVPGAELAEQEDDEDADLDQSDDDKDARRISREVAERLADRQEFLRQWAEDIHLTLRLVDGEKNSVQYGDGVYLLGWDSKAGRPTCAVMDPGFYFPVLPDSIDTYAYPEKVHFAWELPPEDSRDGKTRLRRITYELRDLVETVDIDDAGELVVTFPENTTLDKNQRLVREYPWAKGAPSFQACYLTDATWILDDIDDSDIDALSLEHASFQYDADGNRMEDHDLEIDFLPVVHVPNTPPGGHHFGQSSLAAVLQILDDLQNADTDAQRASNTTGSPIIGVSGTKIGGDPTNRGGGGRKLVVRGGEVWELGADGTLHTVDTSDQLAELREFVGSLRDRLSTNSRLPAAVLGTMDPSKVPSGYAMQLSFGPLDAMIRQMRLVRSVKHPLILKIAQRLYQANGVLKDGPTPRAEIRLGSYLPSDQAGTLELVATALDAGLISVETGVQMLVDVGFPVDDIAAEIALIQSRDFKGAGLLADATGDGAAVAKYLGSKYTEGLTPAPSLNLPPGPPDGPPDNLDA